MAETLFNLRLPLPSDAPLYNNLLCDPEITVWLEDRLQYPISYTEVETFVLGKAWLRWAIECDGNFIGMTGLEDYSPQRGVARFFIVIGDRTYWGRGIGQGVIDSVVRHGFENLGLRKIISNYLEPNKASQIIHDRADFVVDGHLRKDCWRCGTWVDQILLSRFRDE